MQLLQVLFSVGHDATDVLADDVKFEVHHTALDNLVEIGMLMGIGYDGHLETAGLRIAHGEAHAVDRNGTFLDRRVTLAHHFGRGVIYKGIIPTAVDLFDTGATGGAIDMSLHDVSVETTVHEHTAFEVHLVADLQPTQITPVEGLLYGGHRVGIAFDAYHGQAHTVMCHALVYFQLLGKLHDKVRCRFPCSRRNATTGAASSTIPENIRLRFDVSILCQM